MLKRKIITPSASIIESVFNSKLNNNEKTIKVMDAFLKLISTNKNRKYLKIYIEKINNPINPNLFRTCNNIEWGPEAAFLSVNLIIFK